MANPTAQGRADECSDRPTHPHYLKSSVWCAHCGSRLCISKNTNRHGQQYGYFMCVGRHQKRTDCTMRYLPIEHVEAAVEEKWRNVQLNEEYAALLREVVISEIRVQRESAERDRDIARRRIRSINEKQGKLLEAHYANALPLDLLKSEQDRLTEELAAAKAILASSEMTFDAIESNLQRCLAFLTSCYDAYLGAPPKIRRLMNQAVFERFLVDEDGAAEAELAGMFGVLLASDLITDRDDEASGDETAAAFHRDCDWRNGVPAALEARLRPGGRSQKKPRPALAGLGSKHGHMVPPTGFEPVRRP